LLTFLSIGSTTEINGLSNRKKMIALRKIVLRRFSFLTWIVIWFLFCDLGNFYALIPNSCALSLDEALILAVIDQQTSVPLDRYPCDEQTRDIENPSQKHRIKITDVDSSFFADSSPQLFWLSKLFFDHKETLHQSPLLVSPLYLINCSFLN